MSKGKRAKELRTCLGNTRWLILHEVWTVQRGRAERRQAGWVQSVFGDLERKAKLLRCYPACEKYGSIFFLKSYL